MSHRASLTPISVIIPVRNEGSKTARAIRSLATGRSSPFPLEIIVVDDASTDNACDHLHRHIADQPSTRLILRRLPRWSGIPFARNRGAQAASSPIYVITDANTTFPPHWDLHIRHAFHPARLLAGTIVDQATGHRGHGCALRLPSMGVTWLPTPPPHPAHVPVAACTCTVIARSLFHHLGGYDETLPLYGAAEPEFSLRAWLSGYEIVNLPHLLIQHRFRPRHQRDRFTQSHNTPLLRNYLRFACYYLPPDLLHASFQYFNAIMQGGIRTHLQALTAAGVWARRARLREQLPRDFHWFARKFHLPHSIPSLHS